MGHIQELVDCLDYYCRIASDDGKVVCCLDLFVQKLVVARAGMVEVEVDYCMEEAEMGSLVEETVVDYSEEILDVVPVVVAGDVEIGQALASCLKDLVEMHLEEQQMDLAGIRWGLV